MQLAKSTILCRVPATLLRGRKAQMSELKIVPNQISYSAAATTCAKGNWPAALLLIYSMVGRRLPRDQVSWNAAIDPRGTRFGQLRLCDQRLRKRQCLGDGASSAGFDEASSGEVE